MLLTNGVLAHRQQDVEHVPQILEDKQISDPQYLKELLMKDRPAAVALLRIDEATAERIACVCALYAGGKFLTLLWAAHHDTPAAYLRDAHRLVHAFLRCIY